MSDELHKTCNACKEALPLASYSRDKSTKDGHARKCKACSSAYGAKWYAENREKVLDRCAARFEAKREEILAHGRNRYHSDPGLRLKLRGKHAAWAAAHPDKMREYARKSNQKHAEKRRKQCADWRARNRDKHLALVSRWVAQNKHASASYTAKRRAAKRASVAIWADSEFERLAITEAYSLAVLRTAATGIRHEVDHIVPLRGKTVCGLHCAANLRVIPAALNVAKGNRYWPDMP